nr:reverse transcriptase domain-containing protein [Tanacetum cinerariifolium]
MTGTISLSSNLEDIKAEGSGNVKGKTVGDADLKKPFNEALRTPLTCRIIEFAGLEYITPTNIKLYDGTTDLEDHLNRFANAAKSEEWPMLRYSDKVPQMVEKMMVRLDDFVHSEEAFARTELPKGEACEHPRRTLLLVVWRDDRERSLHERLHLAKKIVRNGVGIKEIESSSEWRQAESGSHVRTLFRKPQSGNNGNVQRYSNRLGRFAGEVIKPLEKIDLEVCFGNEGMWRRTTMKFTIIRAPSLYNIILGRSEKKQMIEEKPIEEEKEKEGNTKEVSVTKDVEYLNTHKDVRYQLNTSSLQESRTVSE